MSGLDSSSEDEADIRRSVPLEEVGSENMDHNPVGPEARKGIMDYWSSMPSAGKEHASEPVEDDKNYVFGKKKENDE